MRSSALVSSVALAFASVSHADIFQYEDCDGDGSLLLTELDAVQGVDLSGLYLGCADLSGAFLLDADLSGADLTNANLSDAYLEYANLSGADLSGADLSPAELSRANLSGADLSGADLSGAYLLGTDLTNANLTNANLTWVTLTIANLTGVQSGGTIGGDMCCYFEGYECGYPDLPAPWQLISGYLLGPSAKLQDADLTGAGLLWTNLSDANLSGANLTDAYLEDVNLSGADLSGAILTNVCLLDTNLEIIVPDQTGSCCTNSGCASISESNCSAMGGTWTEGGSCDDCQPAADECPADIDGDGTIGFSDVLVILNDWGVCP